MAKTEKFCGELWAKLKPARAREIRAFLRGIPWGYHGWNERAIMREAKWQFGEAIDWATIKDLILAYLPTLLDLLKCEQTP